MTDVSGLTSLRALVSNTIHTATPPPTSAPRLVQHAALLASELTTNALHHGRSPAHVEMLADATSIVLDVADLDSTTAPVLAGRRGPGDGGFGLMIALQVAAEMGWYQEGQGKHVWARLTTPAPGGAVT